MASSLLLYVLLALWLLPAAALVVVYCADLARDWGHAMIVRWRCYRARRTMQADPERARAAMDPRRSLVVRQAPQEGMKPSPVEAPKRSGTARPYFVGRGDMQVPLVLEDEAGELHTQQWKLGLN